MIRFFVLVGIVGGLAVAYLTTLAVGPETQLPPSESLLTGFREQGFVPQALSLEDDETGEESGAFEVPQMDEVNLAAAMKAQANMPGMDMSGADDKAMDMGGDGTTAMDMNGADGTTMDMADAAGEFEPIVVDELELGEGGLVFYEGGQFDREINLDMTEWEFSQMQIDVKMGERIKFTVKNTGQIPHEFMFMTPPLMQAVAYRAARADWSLFEHVALFEKALVLPGGEFTFVLDVQQAGSWMFMCMLPYHMQMGMMGQMATEGMAMQM